MIDAIIYSKQLDVIEKHLLDKGIEGLETIISMGIILGVATARNEIKRFEGRSKALKKFSDEKEIGVWQKVMGNKLGQEDIDIGKGMMDKTKEFWNEYTLKIRGVYDEDKLRATEKILESLVEKGYTERELKQKISETLGIWNKRRLEMIARTETTKAYNYGKIETFRANAKDGGIVRAVKFQAILDSRVSNVCEARNGLVFDINDPRIDENTPPLHISCRSMWVPVDRYDYEEKHNGKSSPEWDEEKVTYTSPGKSWGNPFAYGGYRPKKTEEMEKYIVENYKKIKDNLNELEKDALWDYSLNAYTQINNCLRGKAKLTEENINYIKNIDSAMDKYTTDKKLVVYRGISSDKLFENHKVGSIIEENGFLSGSFQKETAEYFAEEGILLRIEIPKGTKMIPMEKEISGYDEELELLFERGLKFRIKARYKLDKYEIIWLEGVE